MHNFPSSNFTFRLLTSSWTSLNEIVSYLACFSFSSKFKTAAAAKYFQIRGSHKTSMQNQESKINITFWKEKSMTFFQKSRDIMPQLWFFRTWHLQLMKTTKLLCNFSSYFWPANIYKINNVSVHIYGNKLHKFRRKMGRTG